MNTKFPQFRNSRQLMQKEYKEQREEYIRKLLAVSVAVLVDRFQFTDEEVKDFAKYYMEWIGKIGASELNMADIEQQLKEFYDIEVVKE